MIFVWLTWIWIPSFAMCPFPDWYYASVSHSIPFLLLISCFCFRIRYLFLFLSAYVLSYIFILSLQSMCFIYRLLACLLLSFSVSLKLLRSLMLCYSQLILVLFALFFCVSWCGGNVLLVMFQFTLKSLDCIGWFEWIRLLLSLLYRIDFVDVFLLCLNIPYFLLAKVQDVLLWRLT